MYPFFQYTLTSVYRKLTTIEPLTSMAVSNAAYTTIDLTGPLHGFQRGHLQLSAAKRDNGYLEYASQQDEEPACACGIEHPDT